MTPPNAIPAAQLSTRRVETGSVVGGNVQVGHVDEAVREDVLLRVSVKVTSVAEAGANQGSAVNPAGRVANTKGPAGSMVNVPSAAVRLISRPSLIITPVRDPCVGQHFSLHWILFPVGQDD